MDGKAYPRPDHILIIASPRYISEFQQRTCLASPVPAMRA